MNPTQTHWQRLACFFLALFLILMLPASGAAQESTEAPVEVTAEQSLATPLVEETPLPTAEIIVTAAPDVTATPEVTPEVTATDVPATPEATAEVTAAPEATAEVTANPEATAEVTAAPEATAEVTEEPEFVEMTDEGIAKFPDEMVYVIDLIVAGDYQAARQELIGMAYSVDSQNRVALRIRPAAGASTQAIEQRVNRWNGRVVTINPAFLIAYIPMNKLANLLESDLVGQIFRPATARATGPIGGFSTEAFNLSGVQDWHAAGFTGSGVRIGIIDTGFSIVDVGTGTFTDPEFACLGETPAPSISGQEHGIYMIQAICDIAPNASVFTYEVSPDADASLAQAINEAIFDQIDVLVISLDISHLAPGDGTGLENGSDDPYEALATARAGGMVIFAAAGNYGQTFAGNLVFDAGTNAAIIAPDPTDTRGDRYITFSTSDLGVGDEVGRIYMRVTIGDDFFISWNDWGPNGLGLSDEANLEDFTIEIWEYDTATGNPIRKLNSSQDVRTSLFVDPSFTFTFGRDIGATEGCVFTNDGGTYDDVCNVVVRVFRAKGDSSVVFHAGITQRALNITSPTLARELQTSDVEIVDFAAVSPDTSLFSSGGTISRPADSPDVIAVGAVCGNENSNFALDPNSSQGAIYGENGIAPTLPVGALTQSTVKPDIVSFSWVSPRPYASTPTTFPDDADETSCDGTFAGLDGVDGFGGTSAAAAHAAGMTAVMLSNPSFRNLFPRDADGVQAIQNYIQRRSVELPLGSAADGYDYDYGAGLFILGSPDFNPVNVANPSASADLLTVGTNTAECDKDGDEFNTLDGLLFYVGQANLESSQDGSLTNPFLSISQAINAAEADASYANDCIVVMPGEYVTPILINTGNVSIYSYDSVTSLAFTSTVIRVSGQYSDGTSVDSNDILINKNGAIYIDGEPGVPIPNVLIQGFIFSGARVLSDSRLPSALPRQAIFADTTTGVEIVGNSFGVITADGSTFDGFTATPIILYEGDTGHVDSNTFVGNVGGSYDIDLTTTDRYISPVISVFSHGSSNATAAVLYHNLIQDNTASELATGEIYWSSLVYASDSFFDIAANTFVDNTASTLVYIKANANEDIRIVSNAFQNNVLSTTGAAQNDPAGALVQISSSTNELSFVNNSVLVNTMSQSTAAFSAVIGRGVRSGSTVALATVGRFDFTNNLVYGNTMPAQRIIASSNSNTVDASNCINLAGVTDTVPIRNNWWHNYPGAECGNAMSGNGNRTTNPLNEFIGRVLTLDDEDGNNINYYILGVIDTDTDPDVYGTGVDRSRLDNVDDTDSVDSSRDTNGDLTDNPSPSADPGLDELGNGINMLLYPFNLAANGEARVFDIETWHSEGNTTPPSPTNPAFDLDIGAFEFVNLNILPNILADTFIEDTPLHAINLDLDIEGGFGSLEFRVLTPPVNYGTQCGPEFADGVAFGTGALAQVFYYCPPPDFYTLSSTPPYPSSVDIVIEVEDDIGLTDSSTISLTINPDTAPVPVDSDMVDVTTFTADDFVVVANVEEEGVLVRLRPYVNFAPFAFSERGNADFFVNGAYAVDYPFTYSAMSVFDDPQDIIKDDIVNFVGTGTNEVYAQFDMTEAEGTAVIQYTVTETRPLPLTPTSRTFYITVRTVVRIPRETGIYDDSSFAFDYTGNWSAVSEVSAINNTLHTTNANQARTSFGFDGTGFTLYMKGQGGTAGGNFALRLYIDGAPTATTVTGWTPIVNPDTTNSPVYRAIVSDEDTVFFCTTDAIRAGNLSSTPADYYAITCNGFEYTDDDADNQYDDDNLNESGSVDRMDAGVHLVEIENLSTKRIAVDAFTLLDDNETPPTTDVAFRPGFHDVDELELRSAFGSDWRETRLGSYSNALAYVLTGPHNGATATNTVSFHVNGGTGFAIGTTQESMQTAYTVCVTNISSGNDEMTCQSFDYIKPATTPLLYGFFRPFYGLTPDTNIATPEIETTYRVDILPDSIPAGVKLVIDSVVVFEPTDAPLVPVVGSVDDSQVDSFVLGGGLEDSWTFSSIVTTAFNSTLTTVTPTVRGAGPYIAFTTDDDVDTVYWTTSATRLSAAALVCVDRAEGVDTNANGDAVPANADVITSHGNCIVVNLLTGNFWRVAADGSISSNPIGDGNIQLTKSTFILDEGDFRVAWESFDSDDVLVFEIFSIYDTSIGLDRVVAIGSGVALTAGRYEEYTQNIDYLQANGTTAATIEESESTSVASYAALGTDFVQVFGAGAARDFAQGVMYTKTRNLIISFRFTGTGFAPGFRMMPSSEEVEICWIADPGDTMTANDALNNGVCQVFDNQSRTTVNNGLRPILGLTSADYRVAIRFRGDNFSPTRNTSAAPDMWFDGVVIYNDNLPGELTALTNDTLYEGNFSRHEEFELFEYLGTGWLSDTSARARTFSSANVDAIARGEVGATVSFETSGANAIVLTRNLLTSYTPFLVCATEIGNYQNRYCQTINNTGRGTRNTITVYLSGSTTAPGNYIVNITALTNGGMYFDAVTAMDISDVLTEGQYDDNDPHIIYNYNGRNLILNGDFESIDIASYWTGASTRVTGTGVFYTGTAALNVNAAMNAGITSHSFELQDGVTYTFSASVKLSSGSVRMELNTNPVTTAQCVAITVARPNAYQPLRCTFTPGSDGNYTLSFFADGGAAVFNVDDVRVTEGAAWLTVQEGNAYGGFRSLSTTHGAEIRFGIDGTGFGLGLNAETTGGRMMVCYKSYDPLTEDLLEVSFDYNADDCITFENESSILRSDTMRIVDGLASDTYAVMVRDMEDGDSVLRSPAAIRTNRLSVGQIRLDYILVFDTVAPAVTISGTYNESAVDGSGDRFLQLLPEDRWSVFQSTTFSDGSYASPIDANALASRTTAGGTALLSVTSGSETRVVIDLKTGTAANSNQILACADAVDGIVRFNHTTNRFEIVDSGDAIQECAVITNLTTSRYIVLTPDNLEPLGNPGTHTIIVQPLSAGSFTLDDYQILFGGVLLEGYYEESLVEDISTTFTGTWTTENNPLYSGGSALALGASQTSTISFDFTGTGISIITGLNTTGGGLDIDIIDTATMGATLDIGDADFAEDFSTDFGAVVYGNGYSFTGLPSATYRVTITANTLAGEKFVLDAVEIYGTLQTLGSLYDDNETDSDGNLYLTYGPDNAAWTLKTGAAAPTALNRTLHSTNRAGATLSFEMSNATGIILYYGAGTVTNPRVCFRNTGTLVETCPNPVTPMTTAAGNVQYNAPGTGSYFVSITNIVTNGNFQVDAIQVLEAGLHEGIFDAADIENDSTSTHNGTFNAATNTIELATNDTLSFDMTGIAFSLIVEAAVNQANVYTICVETDNTCDGNDIVNENFRVLNDNVPGTGLSAISYAGLQSNTGAEQTVTVHITNLHAGTMRIKALHILGQDTGVTINDTARHENTASEIFYLPFGSMVNTVVTGNRQSGGSEHSGSQFGEMVYFEIKDLSAAATTGFEYVRQLTPGMTNEVEVCYGLIGDGVYDGPDGGAVADPTQSSAEARAANQCFNFDNVNATPAFQVSEFISTEGYCRSTAGCWVTIRNQEAKPMSFDYVRLFDTGAALTEGYYQDSYPGLNYSDNGDTTGGEWVLTDTDPGAGVTLELRPISNAAASDGFIHQATIDEDIDNENGPIFWFVMEGTGFSIDFVNDIFSDEVEICYATGEHTGFANIQNNVLTLGTCQVFDNEARANKADAQRNVLGLPFDTYTVAVRMHRDNLLPAAHSAAARPIKMNIDGVEIYNEDWTSLENLTGGNRYDTDYLGRLADNRFVYVGESWTTLSGTRARSNSGGNLDQVREYGGAIAFRASGADSLTLYTNLGRSNTTFRICATPVDLAAVDPAPKILGDTVCQDFSTTGTGNQQPISFRFRDYFDLPETTYLVSISSMDDLIGFVDAIELSTTAALTEGFYEGTNVNLFPDSVYQDYVYNGRMEVNGYWEEVRTPSASNQSAMRYEGAFGWHVVADEVGDGIESQPFALDETDVTYTAIARVKVTTGTVRMRLVQGTSQASITEFRTVSPTGGTNNGDWITLRAEFQLLGSYDDLRLQVVANSTNSTFDVDDVHLYRGGLWTGAYNRGYTAGSAWQSLTAGSSLYFSFTGTGFELGTEFGVKGGELEICYDTNNVFGDSTDSCFIYQNESNRPAFGVARTVAGLPNTTYYVRIRDDEDGRSGFRTRVNSSRVNTNAFARITVDYIRIFGANTITPTPASFFNEDATDASGNPYLQLYPSAEWAGITARANTGFSANTYQSVVGSNGRTTRTEAGQSAVLYVEEVPAEGATVVLYTGPANRATSAQFLVCAGNEMSGRIDQSETKVGTGYRISFFLNSPSTPGDCVLLDGTLGAALAVGPDDLAVLGTPGTNVRVSFTSLTAGQFLVDGFQVIYGSTLTAGVYDSFLPDNLLNFNSSNATSANRAVTGCNPDFNWCTVKVARTFGGTVLSTQDQNASLTFEVQGTGFSILTNIGVGARMRICYTQTPLSGDVSFPAEGVTHDNSTQDLSLGEFWCEIVTTNTTSTPAISAWNNVNTGRRLPARSPQYGFAYYGLPFGNYSVQVLMLDTVPAASANALQIDAIVVFGDYNELDVMGEGFYDNTEASVSFEPFIQWNDVISRSGPPRGPYNLTETTTTNSGAIMQMQVDGNSVTLFQTLGGRNTNDARICVIITGAVIHCTSASATSASAVENPPLSPAPYALAFELANFSQAGRTTYFAPIMFYGLGDGEHTIIIENRDHTKTLSFDAILIQE